MSNNLIFNPFLEFHVDSEKETDFLLLAPKRKVGLQILRLNEKQDKKLLGLIKQYANVGLDYLDIDNDLSSVEKDLFVDYAILIDEAEKSEKPLFSCQLDDVEVSSNTNSVDLIVNPTIYFKPMNLATFKEWIYQRHHSPNQTTAWIENPVTKIEEGFWLTNEQAEIVSKFEKGEPILNNIDDELLQKLVSAQLVVSKKQFENETENWNEFINTARTQFKKNRYFTIEKLLSQSQMKAMQKFYREYISQGFMEFGDEFVNRRFRQHNEPLARYFHKNLAKLMSLVVGQEIIPSYCYAASYIEGAELTPHVDRKDCEFSISFQVDYQPDIENNESPWALHLAIPEKRFEKETAFTWQEFYDDSSLSGNTQSLHLANGEGLFYKGRELIHYRSKLSKGHSSTSLFFHYVPLEQ